MLCSIDGNGTVHEDFTWVYNQLNSVVLSSKYSSAYIGDTPNASAFAGTSPSLNSPNTLFLKWSYSGSPDGDREDGEGRVYVPVSDVKGINLLYDDLTNGDAGNFYATWATSGDCTSSEYGYLPFRLNRENKAQMLNIDFC